MNVAGIEVRVDKKKIKNLHLYVKPPYGVVSVSAPLDMSDIIIEHFVRTKISWLKIQIAKYSEQLRQADRQFVSGETLYIWGKQYFLQVEFSSKKSFILKGNIAKLTVLKESTIEQRDKFVREWYREQLTTEVKRLLPKWEAATGLKCDSWQTKYMTSKWGSCNIEDRKIWFNLQLSKKPFECLEYIILHELIHLRVKDHNIEFTTMMDKYMPLWREIKKRLNMQILDCWVDSREN